MISGLSRLFFISIHALREEGDPAVSWFISAFAAISIHALREEGDGFSLRKALTL